MVNVQAAVEAQLFGANVVGMVSREEKDSKTVTQFLVMPSRQEENQSFTVDDIVKEINRTIYSIENGGGEMPSSYKGPVKAEDVNRALSVVGLQNAELTFLQTFVYYKGEKAVANENQITGDQGQDVQMTAEGDNPADSQGEKPHIEYAIGIRIKGNPEAAQEFHFLNIKEIYINVWDTSRQAVLDRMNIWRLDQIGEKEIDPA